MPELNDPQTLRESGMASGHTFSGPTFAEQAAVRQLRRQQGESFVNLMGKLGSGKPQDQPRTRPTHTEIFEAHNRRVLRQREVDRLETEHREQVQRIADRLKTARDAHSAAQARYLAELGGPLETEAREALAAARQERQDAEDLATVPIPRAGVENLPDGALKRSMTHTFEQIALAEVAAIQNSGEVIAALKTAFAAKGIAARGCSWPEFLTEVFGGGEPRDLDLRAERTGLVAKYGALE